MPPASLAGLGAPVSFFSPRQGGAELRISLLPALRLPGRQGDFTCISAAGPVLGWSHSGWWGCCWPGPRLTQYRWGTRRAAGEKSSLSRRWEVEIWAQRVPAPVSPADTSLSQPCHGKCPSAVSCVIRVKLLLPHAQFWKLRPSRASYNQPATESGQSLARSQSPEEHWLKWASASCSQL